MTTIQSSYGQKCDTNGSVQEVVVKYITHTGEMQIQICEDSTITAQNGRAILRLIDLLYSCVDGESSWSSVLDALAEHFDASVVGITTNASLQAVVGVDPMELSKYQTHYLGINPWLASGRSYPAGKVLLTEEVLPLNLYRKSTFYNEWGKRNLVAHAIGGAIRVAPKVMLFLSINRGHSQEPFAAREREDVETLMPHLQRAANLHDQMNTLEERAWVLDTVAFPMMYVAPGGTVRWANEAADNLLRSGRGLRLQDGRLRAELASDDSHLQRILGEVRSIVNHRVDGYGGWLRITRADDGSQVTVFLARAPRKVQRSMGVADGPSGFLAFVALQAVDGNTLAGRLRKTWGLTVAESALAVEILESDGLQLAADKLGISRNTAKSQLSLIFQKTGARRQSELVRKLLALAVIAASSDL